MSTALLNTALVNTALVNTAPSRASLRSTNGTSTSSAPPRTGAERAHLRLVEPLPTRTHLRITRRGRVVLGTLVTLVVLAALGVIAILGGTGATASSAPANVSFQHVTVQPGESLWDIAEGLDSSADPRDVIVAIEQLNDLPSSEIAAGESLAIPVEYSTSK